MSSDEKIKALLVLDIVGRPKEHLLEVIQQIIEEIDKEKGVSVTMKDIKVPTELKDQKDIFTTFAEVEVEVEDLFALSVLLFKYMPAHIEILSPEKIEMSNNYMGEILSELARRLHGYDEIARVFQTERALLINRIHELGGNLENMIPKNTSKEIEEEKKDLEESKKGKK